MRILHVTDTFLPRLGGIELHVADLAARQVMVGDQALVLTAERSTCRDPAGNPQPTTVPVHRLRSGLTGIGRGSNIQAVIADLAPDLIHVHLTVGSPFAWAVLRQASGFPVVASMHSLLPDLPNLVRAAGRVARIPTEEITFTAVSQVAAARLLPALRPDQRIGVLHNGVDPDAWRVVHTPADTFEILVVGRLAARKRPLVMVDALDRLSSLAPGLDWRATFVGDGAQRAKVVAATRRYGLDGRVRIPGALARDDIKGLLGRADVLVAPATLESFGIAALEARCAGVPVIAMAGSGITEFVTDRVDGLLARTDDDLARCLHQLATDDSLADAIRRHNSTVPVRMGWDAVVRSHAEVYDATLFRYANRSRMPPTGRRVAGAQGPRRPRSTTITAHGHRPSRSLRSGAARSRDSATSP